MVKDLPKNTTFTLKHLDDVPQVPSNWRICPTCLDPMQMMYAWYSSESVIHYMFVCHCGSRSKGKLMHFRLDKKGQLVR